MRRAGEARICATPLQHITTCCNAAQQITMKYSIVKIGRRAGGTRTHIATRMCGTCRTRAKGQVGARAPAVTDRWARQRVLTRPQQVGEGKEAVLLRVLR
jgi:hypothetical protein